MSPSRRRGWASAVNSTASAAPPCRSVASSSPIFLRSSVFVPDIRVVDCLADEASTASPAYRTHSSLASPYSTDTTGWVVPIRVLRRSRSQRRHPGPISQETEDSIFYVDVKTARNKLLALARKPVPGEALGS
ncbi:hypothetical protein XA68_16791 [Ophiocordyceps unilateralis]|uniref:Uncharacterized protein n=1 Tax=Ophiocordyceps unilateralis TaxID=268505 RepID=A0A2A9P5X8_OPHUN|nr:hypothetical protein XA68_16791 [Ophiocordyceps unilateralis]